MDVSTRTTFKRLPERGTHDRATVDAIVDEALICHVGFVHDGYPVVIPTIHARVGDTLYFHGSPASRAMRALRARTAVCVTITLLDGLVVARAPFHSSMNYRSVMVFGVARPVDDPDEKWEAVRAVTEHVTPGRWDDSRRPNDKEMKGTVIAAVSLDEASAKVRTGPPKDDAEDYDLPIWAGVVPLVTVAGAPEPDPDLTAGVSAPAYLVDYRRPGSREETR